MPNDTIYLTDDRLKNYLDADQLARERMCLAILCLDKRFVQAKSRHPRGGPDRGRDIEAVIDSDGRIVFVAVGFINQATDIPEHKKQAKKKFNDDLENATRNAIKENVSLGFFAFFTNVNLTIREKNTLINKAKKKGIPSCEIFDRERLRFALNNVDGLITRHQYLNIPLSDAEQASFFAKWGNDIQSVISSGFQKIDGTLHRLLFLQEATSPMEYFIISFELDREYNAEEIGHFRLFCSLSQIKKLMPIKSMLFGCSDKSERLNSDSDDNYLESKKAGMDSGICSGQWEKYWNANSDNDKKDDYTQTSSSSSIGSDSTKFLRIVYEPRSLFRTPPYLSLADMNGAWYVIILNKKLAEKVKTIQVISNEYKLNEYSLSEFRIDTSDNTKTNIPIKFTENELSDPWVIIRPKNVTNFSINFYNDTPKRLRIPNQIADSLDSKI